MQSPETLPSSSRDIERLITPEGSLYASAGDNYQYMIFGRDAIESCDDVLERRPDISLGVIDNLIRLQGLTNNPANAEEFGKTPHQHMQLIVNGQRIPESSVRQMLKLSEKWGGDENGFTYYGSLDATPLFARLVARHGLIHGTDFLQKKVPAKNGEMIARREALRRSLNWVCDHIDSSELSLLEFKRPDKNHIVVQSWKDSGSSYMHQDGSQVNLDGFIAPLEVQGYAYDALLLSSRIGEMADMSADEIHKMQEYAENLRENTLKRFWISGSEGFAPAIDRDDEWKPRRVETPSSTQSNLLDTRMFFGLDEDRRREYVGSIVSLMHSNDFMTEIGIRCRGSSAADLTGFADYHGSWAVWTKETYDYIKGLKRQGLNNLADDVANRILNMANVSGYNYEFLYVNPDGEVDYGPKLFTPGMQPKPDEVIIATNLPEEGQAWTASAIYATKRGFSPRHHFVPTSWERGLERMLLESYGNTHLLKTRDEIAAKRQNAKNFAIDVEAGIAADSRFNPDWWQ